MTIGLTIPGVETVHPREVIATACYPILGPAFDISRVWTPLAHYTAAINLPDGDLGEFDYQIGPYLRAVNKDYWDNRKGTGITTCGTFKPGYAIGYSFATDWLGGAWELRGFDIFPAATADHNSYTLPILFLTDLRDPASELMMQTARAIWRETRRRSGNPVFLNRPKGHRELCNGCTACPGDPIMHQRDLGLLDLDYQGDDVIPFKKAIRAYDSRASEQAGVDPVLAKANSDLGNPLGPLQPGQSRRVFVGLANNAEVILHSIGHGQPGFLKISGDSTPPSSSLVNFDAADRVDECSQMIALTDGSVWVTAGPAETDFIVEVSARW
jgi:hypothetical protein